MERIFVVGNKSNSKWWKSLPNATYDSLPSFSLGEDGEAKMSEYCVCDRCGQYAERRNMPGFCHGLASVCV